jgi:molecular chaperone HtpG
MLQHNPVIAKIRNSVATRLLTDIEKLSRDNPDGYAMFWGQFGPVLKEGLYDATEHRELLFKVSRFYSTHDDGKLTSLADYVTRMKSGQDNIYYLSGENIDTLKHSPQLEGFRARGLETLLFADTIDDFWLQQIHDFLGKPFQSITKGSIDLSKFPGGRNAENETKKDPEPSVQSLVSVLKELLKDEVSDVRLSDRLTDSPVCLVAGDDSVDINMERVLKIHQKYEAKSTRILEINGQHPLIRRLAGGSRKSADFGDAALLLLDQARIIQGESIPDPAAFARRMASFMEKGLAA